MFRLTAPTLAITLLLTATGAAQSIRPRIPESHAVPLADPGEGSNLIVTGRPELCASEATELIVRRNLPAESTVQSVGRRPVSPSCYWELHGLLPGLYDAFIQSRGDEQILATGEVELARGSTMVIMLEPLDLEVQCRVTIGGVPSQDLRLMFKSNGLPALDWNVAIDLDGNYRTKIRTVGIMCARVERRQPFNPWSWCEGFLPGLRQLDLDIPPGVIRIQVSAATAAWPDQVLLEVAGGSMATSRVVLAKGFRGEFFGHGYGSYRVRLTRLDDRTLLASADVTLSPEQPEAVVVLPAAAR